MKRWLWIVLVAAVTGCRDAPTGAALLDKADSIQRELATGFNKDKATRFAGVIWGPYRHPPVHGDIPIRVGREERTYDGFAFEDVRVRVDPNDGYPCPLVRRTLMAFAKNSKWPDGPWEFVTISGADFDLPVSQAGQGCKASLWHLPSRPIVKYLGPNSDYYQEGVQGRATIVPVPGKSGTCPFNPEGNDPLKIECELVDFEVQLRADVVPVPEDSASSPDAKTRLEIPPVHVPGIRLRTRCDTSTYSWREGCVWQEREDSLRWAEGCLVDSLRWDSLTKAAIARNDIGVSYGYTHCNYEVWLKQRRPNGE